MNRFPLAALNVLIGENGSGKSNFISFFDLLGELQAERLQNYKTKEHLMLVIDGFFDGKQIQVLGDIPVKSKKRVIIAFLKDDYSDDLTTNASIDPIKALRGCARNTGLTEKLLQSRS